MSWKDSFTYSWNFLPLAAGTANALAANSIFADNPVRIHPGSDFYAQKITYTATDPRVYAMLIDSTTGRYITQLPGVNMQAYAGSILAVGPGNNALNFRNYSEPIMFAAGSTVNFRAADFSGAQNTVRISLHGVKDRPGNAPVVNLKRNYVRDLPFTIPIEYLLAANSSIYATITVDIDADWYIKRILCQRTGAALIAIDNGYTDTNWQDKDMHIDNFIGNPAGYNILPVTKFVQSNTVLNIKLTDLSAAPNLIHISFEGLKRYFQ